MEYGTEHGTHDNKCNVRYEPHHTNLAFSLSRSLYPSNISIAIDWLQQLQIHQHIDTAMIIDDDEWRDAKCLNRRTNQQRMIDNCNRIVVVVVVRCFDAEKAHDSSIFMYSKCVPARSIPIEKTIVSLPLTIGSDSENFTSESKIARWCPFCFNHIPRCVFSLSLRTVCCSI